MLDSLVFIGIILFLLTGPFYLGMGYMVMHRVTGLDPFDVVEEVDTND